MLLKQVVHDGTSIYAVTDDGSLLWFQDNNQNGQNAPDGSSGWVTNSGNKIGSGWDEFSRIFAGSEPGVICAIKPTGELYLYKDTLGNGSNSPDGFTGWEIRHIADGWQHYIHVCGGVDGVIYAVKPTGELLWFKHLPKAELTSVGNLHGAGTKSTEWASNSGKQIGRGWHAFSKVLFSKLPILDGIAGLYGIKPTGEMFYYVDEKQDGSNAPNGSTGWAPNSGSQIGQGWDIFPIIAAGPIGMFYCLKSTGELFWYRDAARNGTNASNGSTGWATPSQINTGWYPYPTDLNSPIQIDFNSVTFDDSTPIGGNVHLTLRSDGSFTFWGHFHNSGLIDYNMTAMVLVKDCNGRGYTFPAPGQHLTGATGSGSHDFDFRADSQDDSIKTGWPSLVAFHQAYCKPSTDSDLAALTNELLAVAGIGLGLLGIGLSLIAIPIVWTVLTGGSASGTKPSDPSSGGLPQAGSSGGPDIPIGPGSTTPGQSIRARLS